MFLGVGPDEVPRDKNSANLARGEPGGWVGSVGGRAQRRILGAKLAVQQCWRDGSKLLEAAVVLWRCVSLIFELIDFMSKMNIS